MPSLPNKRGEVGSLNDRVEPTEVKSHQKTPNEISAPASAEELRPRQTRPGDGGSKQWQLKPDVPVWRALNLFDFGFAEHELRDENSGHVRRLRRRRS